MDTELLRKTLLPEGLHEVDVTPEMANHWLTVCPYDRQRAIRQDWVSKLAYDMANGLFTDSADLVQVGIVGNDASVIGGNHRLRAVVKSGVTVPLVVKVKRYETRAVLDEVYANTNGGLVSSRREKLKTIGTTEFLGIKGDRIQSYIAGLNLVLLRMGIAGSSDESTLITRSPRLLDNLLRRWVNEIKAYEEVLKPCTETHRKRMLRGPVVSVALLTLRYNAERAVGFWNAVAGNDGLTKGDPAHALYTMLADFPAPSSTGKRFDYTSRVASCYNAFYEGRPLQKSRTQVQEGGLRLCGTPYDGQKEPNPLDVLGFSLK